MGLINKEALCDRKRLRWILLALILFLIDQVTKYAALKYLAYGEPHHIFSFLNFTLVFNNGVAFSFLNFPGHWQHWFLSGVGTVIAILVVFWMWRLPLHRYWLLSGLSCVLGGAIGNISDRLNFGYVIDFIDFHYKALHWPVFNFADTMVTIGVIFILVDLIFIDLRRCRK